MAFRIVISHGPYLSIAVVCSSSCLSCALECSLLLTFFGYKTYKYRTVVGHTLNYQLCLFSSSLHSAEPPGFKARSGPPDLFYIISPFDILMERSMAYPLLTAHYLPLHNPLSQPPLTCRHLLNHPFSLAPQEIAAPKELNTLAILLERSSRSPMYRRTYPNPQPTSTVKDQRRWFCSLQTSLGRCMSMLDSCKIIMLPMVRFSRYLRIFI